MLDDKTILVTGGTGSFGRAFIRTLIEHHRPKKIIVFSRDELKQSELQQQFDQPIMRYFLGDVRDGARLDQAMRGVDYVVHAAALKQVPAAEYNPMECIKTNVHGAENVINAAIANGVAKVIALSTDKAANPINLYGATKLVSDKLFVAANNVAGGHRTRFSVVRYGNVVGSRGSVVPYFNQLLAEGQAEFPITDPRMTRFWFQLSDGINLVLRSFERMYGGEIFIAKTPSMRLVDLVEAMAPGIGVRVVGLRPGEKLHETLCPADTSHITLEFADHYMIKPTIRFVEAVDYTTNALGETGKPVSPEFEYRSDTNPHLLTIAELRQLHVG